MKARRYQLRKDGVSIVARHPWLFREQMSTAATVFADGQWLRLVDGANQIIGYGMYESDGAIAIRRIRLGATPPDAAWARAQLAAAIAKRAELVRRTDGIRLVNGESDGLPAIVIDRFGDAIVVASYSAGSDALAVYLARVLAADARVVARARTEPPIAAIVDEPASAPTPAAPDVAIDPAVARFVIGPARSITVRPARRRHAVAASPTRQVRGEVPELAHFTEDGLTFAVDLVAGHKTGSYLDLRGLRHALATVPLVPTSAVPTAVNSTAPMPLAGARVLNLFAYSGMLARVAETAGAAEITSVDVSERAIEFAAAHHVTDPARHRFVTADVFEWLPALDAAEQYDVVIVDPPSMTSNVQQVPAALAAYRKLYRAAARHVRPPSGGDVVGAASTLGVVGAAGAVGVVGTAGTLGTTSPGTGDVSTSGGVERPGSGARGGLLVAACCTSRIDRATFTRTVREALGELFELERELKPEVDHPVGFPQADYLKITLWRRRAEAPPPPEAPLEPRTISR